MKHIKQLLVFCLCALTCAAPALARDEFVTVTFRAETTPAFIELLGQTFQTAAPRQTGPQTWVFKVPPLRTRNQYAELFANLLAVERTDPLPNYQVADHISPIAVNAQPYQPPAQVKSSDYVPHELLVKFKTEARPEDIRFINSHHGVSTISVISGLRVHRLRLPASLSVEEAVRLYAQSPLVEYAEPNYRMKIPNPVTSALPGPSSAPSASPSAGNSAQFPGATALITQIPLDGGNQVIVDFKPGTPLNQVAQFHLIYGTREVEKRSHYSYRLQLPPGLNPGVAQRILMLHPAVVHVQRLYS